MKKTGRKGETKANASSGHNGRMGYYGIKAGQLNGGAIEGCESAPGIDN